MKKIALIHFAYIPNLGGVEILLREHAHILADAGYDVTVFTGSGSTDDPRVQVHEIPLVGSILNIDPKLQDNIFAGIFDESYENLVNKITTLLQDSLTPFDTIIVHNMMTVSRNLAFTEAFHKYAAATDKTIVIYTHDHMYVRHNQSIDWDRVASQKEKDLITRVVPKAKYVAISQVFKNALSQVMQMPETSIHVVPNGLNFEGFLEIDPRIAKFSNDHDLFKHFPLILSPVNILPRKNILYSLDVIADLKKTFPDIRYLISGKPSKHRKTDGYLQEVKQRIIEHDLESNVLFLSEFLDSSLKDKELHDLYTLADAVFYFSDQENFGLPLIEAPLAKTPIFVSALDVFKEIAGDFISYCDTQNTSPQETAKTVLTVLKKNEAQFRHHVRITYNLKTIIKEKLLPLI